MRWKLNAHPVFTLNIRSRNSNGTIVNSTNGPIESRKDREVFWTQSSGVESGGPLYAWYRLPAGVIAEIAGQLKLSRRHSQLWGANDAGKPPADMRFLFSGPMRAAESRVEEADASFNDGGLAICFGEYQ